MPCIVVASLACINVACGHGNLAASGVASACVDYAVNEAIIPLYLLLPFPLLSSTAMCSRCTSMMGA